MMLQYGNHHTVTAEKYIVFHLKTSVSEALPEAEAVEAVDFGWKRKRKRLSLVGSGCRKRLTKIFVEMRKILFQND